MIYSARGAAMVKCNNSCFICVVCICVCACHCDVLYIYIWVYIDPFLFSRLSYVSLGFYDFYLVSTIDMNSLLIMIYILFVVIVIPINLFFRSSQSSTDRI